MNLLLLIMCILIEFIIINYVYTNRITIINYVY